MVIIYQKGSLTSQQKVYSRGTSNKSLFIWEFRGSMGWSWASSQEFLQDLEMHF